MYNDKLKITGKQIKSITYLGIVVNIALAVIKIVIGFFTEHTQLMYVPHRHINNFKTFRIHSDIGLVR